MKSWMKRTISIVTATAVVAGSVYLFDAAYLQHADAKETLQSITKVVESVTDTSPYTIVELTPDVATFDSLKLENYKGVKITINKQIVQSMGMFGYYIGGQEPNVKDAAQKFVEYGLNDTALRKNYIEIVTKSLIDAGIITTDEANTSTPIYSSGYQELVKGDISLTDDEKAKMEKGTYSAIPFDDRDSADSTKSIAHKDHLYGYMKQDASGTGHFLYQYVPSPTADPPVADYAVEFLKGTPTSNFSKEYGLGQFEPHFTTADGATVEFAAKFEKIDACKRGYLVEDSSVAASWEKDTNHGDVNQPVYKKDDSGKCFIYAGKVTKLGEEYEIEKADPDDTATEFYLAKFVYTDVAGDGATLYQISDYEYSSSDASLCLKQYALDTAAPLVSNMCGTGIVKVADAGSWIGMTESNLFYKYLPDGGGNYTFNSRPDDSSLRQYYYVEGAEIHFFNGYHNREWFKQYSFDRDLEQCEALNVVVKTIPVSKADDSSLTDAEIDAAKFFILANPNASLAISGSDYTRYGLTKAAGDPTHDIKGAQLLRILGRIVKESIPVISDYSIITSADEETDFNIQNDMKGALMYRFAKILMQQDLSTYYTGRENLTEAELHGEAADPEKIGTMLSMNEYHFVNKNVYVYNMKAPAGSSSTRVPLLNLFYEKEHFADDVVTKAFSEVLLDIENENLFRETDGGRPKLSTAVSQAVTTRYIIGYAQKRAYNAKGIMRILELEPCASYDLQVNTIDDKHDELVLKTKTPYETLINQPETKIQLTQMTTAEFIGKIEDLNAQYDMIYIGMNIEMFNTVTTNNVKTTIYNDTSMNGLVYSNVGDYIYGEPVLAGLLDKDYVNGGKSGDLKGRSRVSINDTLSRYRYSGDDITKDKVKYLKEYVEAGYPLVLANDFIKTSKTNGVNVLSVNADRVDCNSYMYSLIQDVKDKKNVFKIENMTSSLFNWYLNLAKPNIILQDPTSAAQNSVKIVELDTGTGMYYPKFNFKLENRGAADSNSTYDCSLYIDINSDGKFSETTEKLKNFKIKNADGSDAAEDGDKYQLRAGTDATYYGSCELSEAYTGVIPWEIVVRQNGNDYRRMVAKGYYEIKNEKENIKVLQINSNSNNTWNMETTSKNKGIFKSLLEDDCVRFNVDIKTITSNQFSAGDFDGDGAVDDPTSEPDLKAYKKCLDQYDMLILGFADCYQEANATATTAFKEYISEGRSVLFTHDTTSFINAPASQFNADGQYLWYVTYWGYEFNKQIRNLVGLDRYGVLGHNDQKENAYKPKNTNKDKLDEIQGYTYTAINRYRYRDNDKDGNPFPTRVNIKGINTGNGQGDRDEYKTTVGQVNTGQITTYPYPLPSSFMAARTHGQYYQVDLAADDDQDGESDIVVWYTIQDVNQGNVDRDPYRMSPYDVRNNYYIYNKGNITYSGVGHSAVMELKDGNYVAKGSDTEIKLFINTMIAAYQSGLHAPKIKILENYKLSSRELDNIYMSYDSQLTAMANGGVLDATEDLYFNARSVSLLQSTANTTQKMQARLYYEDINGAETVEIDGEEIKMTELPLGDLELKYFDPADSAEHAGNPADIIDGMVYKLKVPTNILKANMNKVQLYLVITQTVKNNKTNRESKVSGSDTAAIVRVQMFNLE